MEDLKKRKLEEAGTTNGAEFASKEEIRLLIEPLAKPQLVDLLSKLCVSNFSVSLPCSFFSAITLTMLLLAISLSLPLIITIPILFLLLSFEGS